MKTLKRYNWFNIAMIYSGAGKLGKCLPVKESIFRIFGQQLVLTIEMVSFGRANYLTINLCIVVAVSMKILRE